ALGEIPGGVKLLAIDEAHCITKWGHDFRPAYSEIGDFRKILDFPQTIALTATATHQVRKDIREVLQLDEKSWSCLPKELIGPTSTSQPLRSGPTPKNSNISGRLLKMAARESSISH
ncbi:MAG: hypothetical protein MK479_08495, partial [Planctomycetes bacterium]|nr:hypothetical protein [Planctomycetota bacterium]